MLHKYNIKLLRKNLLHINHIIVCMINKETKFQVSKILGEALYDTDFSF